MPEAAPARSTLWLECQFLAVLAQATPQVEEIIMAHQRFLFGKRYQAPDVGLPFGIISELDITYLLQELCILPTNESTPPTHVDLCIYCTKSFISAWK